MGSRAASPRALLRTAVHAGSDSAVLECHCIRSLTSFETSFIQSSGVLEPSGNIKALETEFVSFFSTQLNTNYTRDLFVFQIEPSKAEAAVGK